MDTTRGHRAAHDPLKGRVAGLLATALVAGGCATLPDGPVERGLYRDLTQIVETRQRTEWVVDRAEIEQASTTAMRSVCKTEPARREALAAWLDGLIAAEGGPAPEAWLRRGRDRREIDDLLTLERTRALLGYAHARAAEDCPFWLNPDPEFRGVHTSTDRLVLLLESRGAAALIRREGGWVVGGGGAGRLMPAWGLDDRLVLGVGAEVGGFGLLGEGSDGDTAIDASFTAAVPLLVRLVDGTRIWDFEAGLTTFVGEHTWPVGYRVAFGGGVATLRVGAFMPVIVVYLGYEYHPQRGPNEPMHLIGAGTRVGLDFDP